MHDIVSPASGFAHCAIKVHKSPRTIKQPSEPLTILDEMPCEMRV